MALERLVLELALIDGASAGVRALGSNLQRMGAQGQEALRQLNGAVDDIQAGMRALSTSRAMYNGLVAPGVEAAKTLETALANLEVNLEQGSVDRVTRQLAEVEANAARIAGPTRFNQAESVGIHTDLKRAGLQLSDITGQGGAAEAVTQLATAENLSAGEAVSAVTTMGAIFGLQGGEYGQAADLLARAGAASNTNAAQLREALAQAPTAGALGLDPAETLASLGVMANMGIQGGSAGTALNAFLRQASKNNDAMGLGMFGADGSFIGVQAAAEQLRGLTAGRSDIEVQQALNKAFGDEGARFALGLLRTEGGGLEDVQRQMEGARSLEAKVERLASTASAREDALAGTGQTVLATLFRPALDPLKAMAEEGNDALGRLGDLARDNPGLAQGVSFGTLGAVGVAGGYGGLRLLRGAGRGAGALRSIRGLGGMAGLAGGLAEAKALEAAAGVQPVAVTNWPAALAGGSALAELGATSAAGGTAGALSRAVPVAGAAVAGFGIGTALNAQIEKSETADNLVEGAIAQTLLITPLTRLLAEVGDALTGGHLVDQLKTERREAINLTVHVAQDGSVKVQDAGAGVLARVAARVGAA